MSRIRLYSCILVLSFIMAAGAPSWAANFTPDPLRLSAPSYVSYYFDGMDLRIPVKVSGAPATVIFSLFTKDKTVTIKDVRNGYLGWHYVNLIDTCVYVSAPVLCGIGDNTIIWNGRDADGHRMYSNMLTYYLWGYAGKTTKNKATGVLRMQRFDRSFMLASGADGKPLANPVFYDAPQSFSLTKAMTRKVRGRWTIGSDPDDPSFLETTAYFSLAENSLAAVDPKNTDMFFIQSVRADSTLTLDKWKWTPNGEAVLQTDWGENGSTFLYTSHVPGTAIYSGPVSDGQGCLFVTDPGQSAARIYCFDVIDGSQLFRCDLKTWWPEASGAVYGPTNMSFQRGSFFLSSYHSCVVQAINPHAEEDSQRVQWVNGSGDGIGDKVFESGSPDQWACAASGKPPFNGTVAADANFFAAFPAEGLDAAQFGLFTPDGSGAGYFRLPGMDGGRVYGIHIIDTGSSFDGMYYGGAAADGDSAGVWYTGCDSIKGVVNNHGDIFGPCIIMYDPGNGDMLTPGTGQYINWGAYGPKVVKIELTTDAGESWTTITDNIDAAVGRYLWTVPEVNSPNCKIRIIDVEDENTMSDMRGFFTISGSSGIADDADTPRPFVTVSNRPNPFNPSTVIRYELGMPGRANLAVYTVTGQLVRRIDLGMKSRGTHEFLFDGSGLPSGVYLYRMDTGGRASAAGKMLLVR